MKNNQNKVGAESQGEGGNAAPMTEKQKRIAELKKNLLAPMQKKAPAG